MKYLYLHSTLSRYHYPTHTIINAPLLYTSLKIISHSTHSNEIHHHYIQHPIHYRVAKSYLLIVPRLFFPPLYTITTITTTVVENGTHAYLSPHSSHQLTTHTYLNTYLNHILLLHILTHIPSL